MAQQAGNTSVTNQPKVNFVAGDIQTNAGSTIQIPITANIFGNYPLRVLMLNLTVVPLDGSPALTTPVSFSYNPALGSPWTNSATTMAIIPPSGSTVASPGLRGMSPLAP
jgi:hypothetical protein